MDDARNYVKWCNRYFHSKDESANVVAIPDPKRKKGYTLVPQGEYFERYVGSNRLKEYESEEDRKSRLKREREEKEKAAKREIGIAAATPLIIGVALKLIR